MATIVEGDPKSPFSIATTSRCRGGCYSFPLIAPLNPWSVPYNSDRQVRKYHFLSLWYDSNWDWTPVSRPICEWVGCSPMIRETGVQSQVESCEKLKKLYLISPCLTLSIIRYISRVKWCNPRNGVALFPYSLFGWFGVLQHTMIKTSFKTRQTRNI